MTLPAIGDGQQAGDGNTNETLLVGASNQAVSIGRGTGGVLIGNADTSKVGFYGVTKIVRPTNSAQAALTLTTATGSGFGFSTSAAFNAFTAQLENIRASLVLLGLLKGS